MLVWYRGISEETLSTITRNSNESKHLLNTCCMPYTPPYNISEYYYHSPLNEEMGVQRHS